jgi:multicomponent Na+:H+ antiporter subunit D
VITAHLPVLQVIVPLLAAPLCVLLHRPQLVWIFALLVNAVAFLISALLLQQVLTTGAISYELGGWSSQWGIEYYIDPLNAFLLVIITSISTLVLVASKASLGKELSINRHTFFYIAYLLCLAGLLGIVATGDAFNVFVFLEISSLSSYAMIALGKNRKALMAAYQYLIMGTIGATFILIGIGLMYMVTGTLNMHDMALRLPDAEESRTAFAAFAFFIVGVCIKLALFPLHQWLPNAYAYAPSIASAFLAATATKVAIYVLIRFMLTIFGIEFFTSTGPWQHILLVMSLFGIVTASIVAIYQDNVKRLFAYSSVAQIGYIILGFSLGTASGLVAALLHLFNHALMKGALFLALAAVMYRVGGVNLKNFNGLAKTMPWTMAAIVIGGLSLVGVPLTVGFVSKWYLVITLIDQGWWLVVALILFSSLLALVYVWRIVEAAYFGSTEEALRPDTNGAVARHEAPFSILIPVWLLVIANIYFGIDTRLSVNVAHTIAQNLFGMMP